MRLATVERTVTHAPDLGTVRRSQIVASAQMFQVLYSNIYSEKELAIVRELVCNAWDAHVAAGNTDTPIEIHLPDYLEPWLQIRDFGTGLAPEDVPPLYMDYGNSNKTHTDEQIGGFGLGSKSPFCYTDQFSVTSRWNGTAYTFQAFIQADGTPGCVLMGEQPTDEPNGLTVYVPLDPDASHYKFSRALDRLYPHLPTPPTVTGDYPAPAALAAPAYATAFADLRGEFRLGAAPLTVVQGLVPYTVPLEVVTDALEHRPLDAELKQFITQILQTYRLHLHAPVGSFEVAVSREHLSLTETTRQALATAVLRAGELFKAELETRLADADSVYAYAQARDLLPSRTPLSIPDRFRDLLHTDGRGLHIQELFAAGGLKTRTGAHYDHRRRRRYKLSNWRLLYPQQLAETVIYVAPSTRYSVHNFAEELFRYGNYDRPERALFLLGDLERAQQLAAEHGLPCEVRAMPRIVNASNGARSAGGRTRYLARLFNADGEDCLETTTEAIVDRIENDHAPESLLIVLGPPHAGHPIGELFRRGIRPGLVALDEAGELEALLYVGINEQHTKVRRLFAAGLKELGYTVIDRPALGERLRFTARLRETVELHAAWQRLVAQKGKHWDLSHGLTRRLRVFAEAAQDPALARFAGRHRRLNRLANADTPLGRRAGALGPLAEALAPFRRPLPAAAERNRYDHLFALRRAALRRQAGAINARLPGFTAHLSSTARDYLHGIDASERRLWAYLGVLYQHYLKEQNR